ncbi:MAG: Gfo/Idh/MocA family oxidoreductase [SAR324 cluster bacterium]|nr:Gfo/Idh/MocA family oxidoreductase [SAR324 cluster bacterium]
MGNETINLGIIGTGGMAANHVAKFKEVGGCHILSAFDIDFDRARVFAEKHQIHKVYPDFEPFIADPDLDAVSIVTPDDSHCSISLKAIEKNLHVLCEKPLALNYADAKKMADAAKKKQLINMVNFTYRNASALQKARELIQNGKIGEVKHVEASYLQTWLTAKVWGDWRKEPKWLWRLSEKHGSKGVLGDVGVHILDFATFPIGPLASVHCLLKTFHKAENDQIGEYRLDANDSAIITCEYENGAIGTVHTSRWATGQVNSLSLKIFADQGAIKINLDESMDHLMLCRGDNVETSSFVPIACEATPNIFKRFITSVRTGKNAQPDFEQGARIQKLLDACFRSHQSGQTVKII